MSTVVLAIAILASLSAFALAGVLWLDTRRMDADLQGFASRASLALSTSPSILKDSQ